MKIAILSDTHGLLLPQLPERLEGVDAILHAGDLDTQAVLERLQDFAPVYAVQGNNDWTLSSLPRTRSLSLAGVRFFLVHNRRDVPAYLGNIDVVVYGHTHRYDCTEKHGTLWLNPGSCSRPRLDPAPTLVMMEAEDGAFRMEKILLTPGRP